MNLWLKVRSASLQIRVSSPLYISAEGSVSHVYFLAQTIVYCIFFGLRNTTLDTLVIIFDDYSAVRSDTAERTYGEVQVHIN